MRKGGGDHRDAGKGGMEPPKQLRQAPTIRAVICMKVVEVQKQTVED